MTVDARVLDRLSATIEARRSADPGSSYTAKLFSKGRAKIAQKVGEEAVETVIEAMGADPAKLAAESADLLYHLLVLSAFLAFFFFAIRELRRLGGQAIENLNAPLERAPGTLRENYAAREICRTGTPARARCSFACAMVNSPKWKIEAASTAEAPPFVTPSTR